MSERYSRPDENSGRCEGCNEPGSEYRTQITAPVLLGGGIGWGTMYLCPKCVEGYRERHGAEDGPCGEWCRRHAPHAAPAAPGGPEGHPDGPEHR